MSKPSTAIEYGVLYAHSSMSYYAPDGIQRHPSPEAAYTAATRHKAGADIYAVAMRREPGGVWLTMSRQMCNGEDGGIAHRHRTIRQVFAGWGMPEVGWDA